MFAVSSCVGREQVCPWPLKKPLSYKKTFMNKVSSSLNKILVIDDVPVIAFGLLETFTVLNKAVTVEYEATIFSALTASTHLTNEFDLLVVGVIPGNSSESLWNVL